MPKATVSPPYGESVQLALLLTTTVLVIGPSATSPVGTVSVTE
ncbi:MULTISPECIES: hypothetical protein [Kribbella]|nr:MULTISPECIES: hypothetical protein [Kribbella]